MSAGVATLTRRMATLQVLVEVKGERLRQEAKWGEQNHPDGTGPDLDMVDPHRMGEHHMNKRNALRNGNVQAGLSRVWELCVWWWAGTSEARMRRFVHSACAQGGVR